MPATVTVLTPAALAFEEPCLVCEATGSVWPNCSRCHGSGWIPTPLGQRLLEFLRRQPVPPSPGFPP